jgi:hypothetical protein
MTTKSLPPSYSSLYNTSSSKSNKRSKSNKNYDKPIPINNKLIYEQPNNQVIYEQPNNQVIYEQPNNQVIYEQTNPNGQIIYERPNPNNRNNQFIYEESNGHTNTRKNPYYQSSIKNKDKYMRPVNTNRYYSSDPGYNTNQKKYHGPVNNTTSSGNVKVTEKKYIYKNGKQKEQIAQTEYIFNKNDIPYISGLDYDEKRRLLDDRYKSELLNLESQRIYKKIYAYNSYNSQLLR